MVPLQKRYKLHVLHIGYGIYCSSSHSCHFRCCLGGPVEEESCSALLQQQGAPGDEVSSDFLLILPGVSAESRADLPHLGQGNLMPTPKRFQGHRNEGNALLPAQFPSLPHLPFEGDGEGVARVGSGASPCGNLEGVSDGDIEGCILAACPVADEDVRWSSLAVGEDATSLLDGGEACLGSNIELSCCSIDVASGVLDVIAVYSTSQSIL